MVGAIYEDGTHADGHYAVGLKLGEDDTGSGQLPYGRQLPDSECRAAVTEIGTAPWKRSVTAMDSRILERMRLTLWFRPM